MRDIFLKFSDHAEALVVLNTVGVTGPAGEVEPVRLTYFDTDLPAGMLALKPVGAACDGLVYAPTGKMLTGEDGVEYPEMTAVDGYHVNIRMADGVALPSELAAVQVAPEPATPAERFA
ncbi:hypothetical protein [Martelella endophytica]|uniref:Uncharacterized protein n=1 Tax=Martelella endophytica TaxID=1486262 RepID=A0A0D5LSU6_MAREN|nr:hypothetical protein [Martelella endophytica]AJY47030.1 hypothetical protein TM49_17260 [Martelella endophytica]